MFLAWNALITHDYASDSPSLTEPEGPEQLVDSWFLFEEHGDAPLIYMATYAYRKGWPSECRWSLTEPEKDAWWQERLKEEGARLKS